MGVPPERARRRSTRCTGNTLLWHPVGRTLCMCALLRVSNGASRPRPPAGALAGNIRSTGLAPRRCIAWWLAGCGKPSSADSPRVCRLAVICSGCCRSTTVVVFENRESGRLIRVVNVWNAEATVTSQERSELSHLPPPKKQCTPASLNNCNNTLERRSSLQLYRALRNTIYIWHGRPSRGPRLNCCANEGWLLCLQN